MTISKSIWPKTLKNTTSNPVCKGEGICPLVNNKENHHYTSNGKWLSTKVTWPKFPFWGSVPHFSCWWDLTQLTRRH